MILFLYANAYFCGSKGLNGNDVVVYVGQNVYAYLDSAVNALPPSSFPQLSYWEQAINRFTVLFMSSTLFILLDSWD